MGPETAATETQPSASAAISRKTVQLYARAFGRGPTKARAYIQPDYAVCVLRDVFTTAERTLIANGGRREVEASRAKINDAIDAEFVSIVEGETGRSVQTHVTHIKGAANLALHFFLFDPDRGSQELRQRWRDAQPVDGQARGETVESRVHGRTSSNSSDGDRPDLGGTTTTSSELREPGRPDRAPWADSEEMSYGPPSLVDTNLPQRPPPAPHVARRLDTIACDGCGRFFLTPDGPGMLRSIKNGCPDCDGRFVLVARP